MLSSQSPRVNILSSFSFLLFPFIFLTRYNPSLSFDTFFFLVYSISWASLSNWITNNLTQASRVSHLCGCAADLVTSLPPGFLHCTWFLCTLSNHFLQCFFFHQVIYLPFIILNIAILSMFSVFCCQLHFLAYHSCSLESLLLSS